jgi:hypothetical protein
MGATKRLLRKAREPTRIEDHGKYFRGAQFYTQTRAIREAPRRFTRHVSAAESLFPPAAQKACASLESVSKLLETDPT